MWGAGPTWQQLKSVKSHGLQNTAPPEELCLSSLRPLSAPGFELLTFFVPELQSCEARLEERAVNNAPPVPAGCYASAFTFVGHRQTAPMSITKMPHGNY